MMDLGFFLVWTLCVFWTMTSTAESVHVDNDFRNLRGRRRGHAHHHGGNGQVEFQHQQHIQQKGRNTPPSDATITVSLIQVRTQDLAAQFVHDAHVAIWNHHHLQQQQEQQKHGHHHQHGNDHHQNHHQNKHHQHPVDDEGSWVVHLPQHDGRNPHGDSVRPGTFGKYTLTFLDSMIRLISFDGGEETTMGLETAHTNTSVFDALMFEFSHDLLVDYQVSGEALSSGCNLMSSAKTYQGEMVFGEMTYHNGFVVIMSPSSPSPSDEENGTDNGKRKTITIHYSLATGGRK